MRITPCQAALAAAIALNLLLLLLPHLLLPPPPPRHRCHHRGVPNNASPGITVILREFESTPDHDVAATARSFAATHPVLVAAEAPPYPPVPPIPGVALLTLRPQPQRSAPRPEEAVRTKHVALVPDGARAAPGLLARMRKVLESSGREVRVVAAPVGATAPRCLEVEVDVRAWTVRYGYSGRGSEQQGGNRGNGDAGYRGDQGSDQQGGNHGNVNSNYQSDQQGGNYGNGKAGYRGDRRSDQQGGNYSNANAGYHGDQNANGRSDQWSDRWSDHNAGYHGDQWRSDRRANEQNDRQTDRRDNPQTDHSSSHWSDHQTDHRTDHQTDRRTDRSQSCGGLSASPAVLLLRAADLFSLPFPLSRPLATSLSIQASLRGWRFLLLAERFPQPFRPPLSPHSRWKIQTAREELHRALLERFDVKLEVQPDGRRRYFGCAKTTPRCFGTVRSQTPEYLLAGRWTPPCCLRALRLTARHAVAELEAAGVRYWLEGGSLLGAVRSGDIIPWDYDVDLGFYREDIAKCRWLDMVAKSGQAVEDPEGFLWEKAAEGEFYRVHYSRSNRLHVDLWPFYVRPGGVMTKDTWLGHRQDVEFPEELVKRRRDVRFAGGEAKAPRDPRGFLELKFGVGVVENPEYPNPEIRRLEEDLGGNKSR